MRFLSTLALVTCFAAPALAQDHPGSFCGYDEDYVLQGGHGASRLTGTWSVEMGAGLLEMGGQTHLWPAPNQPSPPAGIGYSNGRPFISANMIGSENVILYRYESTLQFNVPEILQGERMAFDNAQLEDMLGCDINAFPILWGSGDYVDPEGGVPVSFDVYLAVLSNDQIYGVTIGRVNSGARTGVARRVFSMARQGAIEIIDEDTELSAEEEAFLEAEIAQAEAFEAAREAVNQAMLESIGDILSGVE